MRYVMTFLTFVRFSHKDQWPFDSPKFIFVIKDKEFALHRCIATFENSTLLYQCVQQFLQCLSHKLIVYKAQQLNWSVCSVVQSRFWIFGRFNVQFQKMNQGFSWLSFRTSRFRNFEVWNFQVQAQFIRSAKVIKSNAYFSILNLAYAMLK